METKSATPLTLSDVLRIARLRGQLRRALASLAK